VAGAGALVCTAVDVMSTRSPGQVEEDAAVGALRGLLAKADAVLSGAVLPLLLLPSTYAASAALALHRVDFCAAEIMCAALEQQKKKRTRDGVAPTAEAKREFEAQAAQVRRGRDDARAALRTAAQGNSDSGGGGTAKEEEGYDFVKIDGGMTEILRPSLYGAQHPIVVVPGAHAVPEALAADDAALEAEAEALLMARRGRTEYVVVGHCCESGDLLTPAPGESDVLAPRLLTECEPGDLVVIEGAGAYCSSMSAAGYNSFPAAAEVLLVRFDDGGEGGEGEGREELHCIRRRAKLEDLLRHEVIPAALPAAMPAVPVSRAAANQ